MNGLKLAPNWAAIAQILGGALAAPDGQYAQGAQVAAQNYQQMAGNRELMDLRRQDAEREQARYDDEKRYKDEIRAREAEADRLYRLAFSGPNGGNTYGTAAGRRPMGRMDAGERRNLSGLGHMQNPDALKDLSAGNVGAGAGGGTNLIAGMNWTPQEQAYMLMAGRAAGLDYMGRKLAASQTATEPYSAIGKARADLNAGLIDQRAYDQIVADELRVPQGPITWSDVTDQSGNVIGQRSSTGQLNYFDSGSDGPKPPSAADLRGEYTKATKDYEQAAYGYSKVVSAANNPSGVGDIALIFGFMKTIDPTSTVREGEFATAQQTAGIPGQVVALYNKALSGERLTPEQRADFAQQAAKQFQVYQDRKGVADQFYTGLAQRNEISPQDVLVPFPEPPTYNPPVTPDVGFSPQVGAVVEWERGPDGKPRKKVAAP